MGAEVFNTPLGWVVFALIFGAIPIYAMLKTREIFSHIDQHPSMRSDQTASGAADSVQKSQEERFAHI
jgi:hypothetical protein